LDIAAALMGLVVLAPLFLAIATLILITMGRPILFRQVRPGLNGRPFAIYKFRTMKNSSAKKISTKQDGERLTTLGKILRATSLDELPELWNVLKGEMSLVGPRPLLMDYLRRYTPEQARRMEVLPGITGWAQVNGRNVLSWDEKFKLDIWYVDHQSFWLDMKILVMTVLQVVARRGISAEGCVTMPEFLGSGELKD
jgi:lipopolysaccharide/colanic/teichoic acid biosynthesis glycosyltransferase